MVGVQSLDERGAIGLVRDNIRESSLNPDGFYNYGYLLHTIAYWLLQWLGALGFHRDQVSVVAFATRFICLISYLGLLVAFHLSLRNWTSPWIRWLFTLGLGATKSFFFWSLITHPDTLQALLVYCAFWTLASGRAGFSRLTLAAVLSGLSFGSKASGIFSLVLLATWWSVTQLLGRASTSGQETVIRILKGGVLVAVVFTTVWLAVNPTVLSQWDHFADDMAFEQSHLAYGHGKKETANLTVWLKLWWADLGRVTALLCLVGLGGLLTRSNSGDRATRLVDPSILAAIVYCVVAFGFLLLTVDMARSRYLMHLTPFLLFLGAVGTAQLFRTFHRWHSVFSLGSLVVALMQWGHVSQVASQAAGRHMVYSSPLLEAGRWVATHYPATTRVIFESYSYLPEGAFQNSVRTGHLGHAVLKRGRYRVAVLNANASARYNWKRSGTKFGDEDFKLGKADGADDAQKFHRWLISKKSGWKVVYENDVVVVFEQKKKPNPKPQL